MKPHHSSSNVSTLLKLNPDKRNQIKDFQILSSLLSSIFSATKRSLKIENIKNINIYIYIYIKTTQTERMRNVTEQEAVHVEDDMRDRSFGCHGESDRPESEGWRTRRCSVSPNSNWDSDPKHPRFPRQYDKRFRTFLNY